LNHFVLPMPSISHQGMDRFFCNPVIFTPFIRAKPALGALRLPPSAISFPLAPRFRNSCLLIRFLSLFCHTKRTVFFTLCPHYLRLSGPLSVFPLRQHPPDPEPAQYPVYFNDYNQYPNDSQQFFLSADP
jgi:hypothetical protein